MPIVPRRQGQIETAPLPGVRLSPQAPEAAFGVPGNGIDVTSPLAGVIAPMVQKARRDADQIAALDSDNKIAQLSTDLETRALSRQGKNALDNGDVFTDFDKGVGEIENGLASDDQKMAFRRAADARRQSLYASVERHAATQHEAYDRDTTASALDLRTDTALKNYDDPGIRQQSMDETRAIIKDFGARQGWSPETIDEKVTTQLSRMYASVIREFADAKQLPEAVQYYEDHKDEFVGEDAVKASALASAARVQNDGDTAAQSILKGDDPTKPLSASDAFTRAEAIADPNIRKIATEAVLQHFTRLNQLQNIERDNARARVMSDLEANGGRLNTASSDWQTINGFPEGEQVLARQHQLLHPPKDPGDPDKYNSIIAGLYTSPATRDQVLSMPISDIIADKNMNQGQKTDLIQRIHAEQNRDATATLADLKRQHADATAETKQFQRDLKQAEKDGDDDARENAQAQLYASQRKEQTLKGQLITAQHRSRTIAPQSGTAAPSATGASTTPDEKPNNAFGLSGLKPLTPDMLRGLSVAGPLFDAYAKHLRAWGYEVPDTPPNPPAAEKNP